MSLIDLILNSFPEREPYPFSYRASSSGKCVRALAYEKLGYKSKPINARGLMVFELGNMVEDQLVKRLGDNVHSHQLEANNDLGFCLVKGHIDFLYKDYVVDVKSTNDWSFKSTKSSDDIDYSYKAQLHCYMHSLKLKKGMILYYNKNTSALKEIELNYDEKIWQEVVNRFKTVHESKPENIPHRECLKINKNGCLGYPCSYCGHVSRCFDGKVELKFDKQNKPQHKLLEIDL